MDESDKAEALIAGALRATWIAEKPGGALAMARATKRIALTEGDWARWQWADDVERLAVEVLRQEGGASGHGNA